MLIVFCDDLFIASTINFFMSIELAASDMASFQETNRIGVVHYSHNNTFLLGFVIL